MYGEALLAHIRAESVGAWRSAGIGGKKEKTSTHKPLLVLQVGVEPANGIVVLAGENVGPT